MFQHHLVPQQQFQQPHQPQQQQMYQPQLQQHVAMVQTPVLYTAQPAAVVSNVVAAPTSSATNTPVSKAVKKGRFRVVKPVKQDPNEIGDGQSVISTLSENPSEPAVAPAVTTKKKGRFLIRTKSVSEPAGKQLSPTKESVADAKKSETDDAVSKGGVLPPQQSSSSDKAVVGVNNVKKKGRFRVKSGLNLADAEASVTSDKADSHVRRPSEETLQSIPKITSLGEVTADENAVPIATSAQVPAPIANTQVPQGMDGSEGNINAPQQYATFIPSMTSYDVNSNVMMVSTPFLTAQNTTMPMMQTSVQQSQIQQMYQHQVQVQQQQQQPQQVPPAQLPEQNVAPSSHPTGLPLSNPNSPNLRTQPTKTQPHVPLLPQQARSSSPIPKRQSTASAQTSTSFGSGSWRGISGSHGKNGRLIGCGGVGKILHNMDSLRQEILDADKSITSLQSDNRLLRNKNKELEAKISNLEKRLAEEKSLRRSTDTKLQALRQKVKELESPAISDTQTGEESDDKKNDIASTVAPAGKQAPKIAEEKSTAPAMTRTAPVVKPHDSDECDGQEPKLQPSPLKKDSSTCKVEGEPKPKSPVTIRRTLTGNMTDLDAKQFDPHVSIAPPLCPPTSSVVMAQNFQSLVDDNIAPIPMTIVTTQKMPSSDDIESTIEPKGTESGQHFDPLGTPEKSQSQLNIQTVLLNPMVPSVPTLTHHHLNGSPAMATVPVYTLPIPTIQLPPTQGKSNQVEHDPFDEIICRGQHNEQNGNVYQDVMR